MSQPRKRAKEKGRGKFCWVSRVILARVILARVILESAPGLQEKQRNKQGEMSKQTLPRKLPIETIRQANRRLVSVYAKQLFLNEKSWLPMRKTRHMIYVKFCVIRRIAAWINRWQPSECRHRDTAGVVATGKPGHQDHPRRIETANSTGSGMPSAAVPRQRNSFESAEPYRSPIACLE